MSYLLALKAYELGRWDTAGRYLAEELRTNPENVDAFSLLAAVELNCGRFQSAANTAKNALALDPLNAYAHFISGLALQRCAQQYEAEIALEEAVRLEPDNSIYLAALASAQPRFSKQGLELLDRALEADPDNLNALHQKYGRLIALNRRAEAEAVRQQILEADPEDARIHRISGYKALEDKNGYADALEHFREALRSDPSDHRPIQGLHEAEYQASSPIVRFLKNAPLGKITIAGWACLFGSLLLEPFFEAEFHSHMPAAVFLPMCMGGLAVMLVAGLLFLVSRGIYRLGLIHKRVRSQPLSELKESLFSIKSLARLFGILIGLALVFAEHESRVGRLHVPLPHWLYSDWMSVAPNTWSSLALAMPFVFFACIFLLAGAVQYIIVVHIKAEPKSTRYFNSWYAVLFSSLGLSLFALVGIFKFSSSFIYVIVSIEILLFIVRASPWYREWVKEFLRKEQQPLKRLDY